MAKWDPRNANFDILIRAEVLSLASFSGRPQRVKSMWYMDSEQFEGLASLICNAA